MPGSSFHSVPSKNCSVALGEKVIWPQPELSSDRPISDNNSISDNIMETEKGIPVSESRIRSPMKKQKLETEEPSSSKIHTEDCSEKENKAISEYEKMILQRKQKDMEFLSSIGVLQVTGKAFNMFNQAPKPRKVYPKLGLKTTLQSPLRRSSRLQNKPPSLQPGPHVEVKQEPQEDRVKEKPAGPLLFRDVSLQEDEMLTNIFLEEFKLLHSKELEKAPRSFSWYKNNFTSMKIDVSRVAKVVPDRIVSLSVHPSAKLLAAFGDKRGRIGLWDVESEKQDALYLYEPHSFHVTCLEFNPGNSIQLYSTSYDGTLRCGDMEAAVFEEVYRPTDDTALTSFAFLSSFSLLVGHKFGNAVIIDRRTENPQGELIVEADHRALKTVSVHPEKNNFITCGSEGVISLWDIRVVKKKKPICQMILPKSVTSAYFSPITGKHILATCMDNTLRVYDSSSLTANIMQKTSIRHDNFTGRWLTPFRAVWLPNTEEGFVVGSMNYPRCIQIFNVDGHEVHRFADDILSSVCCINAFHTQRPILVGGNSSGKAFIFKGKD